MNTQSPVFWLLVAVGAILGLFYAVNYVRAVRQRRREERGEQYGSREYNNYAGGYDVNYDELTLKEHQRAEQLADNFERLWNMGRAASYVQYDERWAEAHSPVSLATDDRGPELEAHEVLFSHYLDHTRLIIVGINQDYNVVYRERANTGKLEVMVDIPQALWVEGTHPANHDHWVNFLYETMAEYNRTAPPGPFLVERAETEAA